MQDSLAENKVKDHTDYIPEAYSLTTTLLLIMSLWGLIFAFSLVVSSVTG